MCSAQNTGYNVKYTAISSHHITGNTLCSHLLFELKFFFMTKFESKAKKNFVYFSLGILTGSNAFSTH